MALSTRELYLALRVRDEGTRNLTRFSNELVRTGTAARIASIKAQADALREQASLKRTEIATERVRLARLRETGATQGQIKGVLAHVAALQKESASLERQAKQFDKQATALLRDTQRFSHLTNTITQTGVALETVGVAAAFAGVGVAMGLKDAIDTAMEYERQVRLTATQVDGFNASLKVLSDVGLDVAKRVAVPFEEIQPALFDIFSSLEVGTADAAYLLDLFSKAAVAGQTQIEGASRSVIGIMNAFKVPLKDVNHILDLQFQLVQEGIGTYEEWTARIGKVSPSAVRAGQSIETMMAALATTTRFGIPAAQASTSVARAFDAMSNPKAINKMEELGIKVRNARGQILPFNEVMRDFRDVLNKMPEKDRVGTILEVFKGAGSTIEARKFLQSILLGKQGLELFDLILAEMQTDTGSFTKAYTMMAETTAAKSQLVSNKWKVMKQTIGEILMPQFNEMLDFMGGLLDRWDKLPQKTKDTIVQFALWGSAIAIVVGIALTFVGILAVFIASVAAAGAVLGYTLIAIVGVGAALATLGVAFYNAWKNSEGFRDGVKGAWEAIKDIWKIVTDTSLEVAAAFEEHLQPAWDRLWKVIEEKVIPAFNSFMKDTWEEFEPKIAEAGRIVAEIAERGFKFLAFVIDKIVIPAIEYLSEWWEKNKASIEPLLPILGQVVKWFLIISAVVLGVLVAAFVGPLVAAVVAVIAVFMVIIELIGAFVDGVRGLWSWLKTAGKAIGDFFAAIGRGIADAWNSITKFFSDLFNNFDDVGTWLLQAGRDLIMGFIRGVQEKTKQAVDTLRNFGNEAIDAVKETLHIGSPSKKMMELGRDSALGYVLGWQNTMANAAFGTTSFMATRPQAMAPQEQPRVGFGVSPNTGLQNSSKTITNNITVHTQELDARTQSELLGWELAGKM